MPAWLGMILTALLQKVAEQAVDRINKIGHKEIWLVEDTKEDVNLPS
jgi:hypothetical protein